jgi:DNA-binding LytR/AlgR family response regulator
MATLTSKNTTLPRSLITELEQKLDPQAFVRIHRKTLVKSAGALARIHRSVDTGAGAARLNSKVK